MSLGAMQQRTYAIGGEGRLEVQARSTDLRLEAGDGGEVRISGSGRDLERSVRVEPDGGGLTVRVRPDAGDLHIELPAATTLRVEDASGRISATGLRGEQRYRTVSGDIRLVDVAGSVTAESMSGDVDVAGDATIRLMARSVSGDLAVRGRTLVDVRGTTTSGDVRLAGRFGEGSHSIETVSGDVVIAPVGPVRIELSTITGDLVTEVDGAQDGRRGRRVLEIGRNGPLVAIRSTSGDVRVVPSASGTLGAEPDPTTSDASGEAAGGDARLDVLRALEDGAIDVAEAERRLAALDEGTRSDDV